MRFLYKIRKKRQKNGRPGQGVRHIDTLILKFLL